MPLHLLLCTGHLRISNPVVIFTRIREVSRSDYHLRHVYHSCSLAQNHVDIKGEEEQLCASLTSALHWYRVYIIQYEAAKVQRMRIINHFACYTQARM